MSDDQLLTDPPQPSNLEKIVTNWWSILDGLPPDIDDTRLEVIVT